MGGFAARKDLSIGKNRMDSTKDLPSPANTMSRDQLVFGGEGFAITPVDVVNGVLFRAGLSVVTDTTYAI